MGSGPVLGIDLGTTNSVVAVADDTQARVLTDEQERALIPSVVAFPEDGPTLVGFEAREQRLVDAENTVYAVKRLIGRPFDSPEVTRARKRFAFELQSNQHGGCVVKVNRGRYALAEISAMVLRELRRMAESHLGEKASRAVITVPANFNELQRSATKAAGKVAGLDVLRIINEPTAAALAYGYGQKKRSERIAVYDLGGGTFDLTVLELENDVFEVVATAGDTFLGGDDIDLRIAETMSERCMQEQKWDPRIDPQAFERLRAAGEWAKCQLSTLHDVDVRIEDLGERPNGASVNLHFPFSRKELEKIMRPWLARSLGLCANVLREAGIEADQLDNIILVGGSTRIPLCRRMVRDFFGKEPRVDIDPDLVIARGAAIHGFTLSGGKTGAQKKLAKVALKRMSRAEAEKLRDETKKRKQPAFAPEEHTQFEDLPVRKPRAPESARAAAQATTPFQTRNPLEATTSEEVPTGLPPLEGEVTAITPPSASTAKPATPPGNIGEDPTLLAQRPSELQPKKALERQKQNKVPPPPRGRTRNQTVPFGMELPNPQDAKAKTQLGLASTALPPTHPDAPAALPALPNRAVPPTQRLIQPLSGKAPLLMDVTPHSLGLETAGGYCKHLILKQSPVPTEQSRTFTTAQDNQREVIVRICQGESETFEDNQVLGAVVLPNLMPAPRGDIQINVTFILSADGTLEVEAVDSKTNRKQATRIDLRGGLSADEIAMMEERHRREMRR